MHDDIVANQVSGDRSLRKDMLDFVSLSHFFFALVVVMVNNQSRVENNE
jgi:hypothetical protein